MTPINYCHEMTAILNASTPIFFDTDLAAAECITEYSVNGNERAVGAEKPADDEGGRSLLAFDAGTAAGSEIGTRRPARGSTVRASAAA